MDPHFSQEKRSNHERYRRMPKVFIEDDYDKINKLNQNLTEK